MAPQQKIKVWDPLIRTFHWSLAAAFLLNFWLLEEGEKAHEVVGYFILALLAIRLLWGFIGPENARFRDFFPTRARLLQQLRDSRQGRRHDPDHHNPLGGLMIICLLAALGLTGISGWLSTLDMFWGAEWLEELHERCASLAMWLVVIHVAAVSFFSWRGPHNLIRSMLTGYRRP